LRCKNGGESVGFDERVSQVKGNADRVWLVTRCIPRVVSPKEVRVFLVVDIVDADDV